MHRESGQRYMPSRSHLTSEGQQVSTIPVRCGQCNYPSATALTIIRHGKIALSITKQASVAYIAGLSLIYLFLYLAGPHIRSLSFFLSLWATYTHSHSVSLSHAHTHTVSLSLSHPCSPILPPTPTLVLDSIHTHLLSGREGGGERSLLSLVCVSSGVCPSVPAYAMNIWPRNRCASSGTSDSLIKGGEP